MVLKIKNIRKKKLKIKSFKSSVFLISLLLKKKKKQKSLNISGFLNKVLYYLLYTYLFCKAFIKNSFYLLNYLFLFYYYLFNLYYKYLKIKLFNSPRLKTKKFNRGHNKKIKKFNRGHNKKIKKFNRGHNKKTKKFDRGHNKKTKKFNRGHNKKTKKFDRGHNKKTKKFDRGHNKKIKRFNKGYKKKFNLKKIYGASQKKKNCILIKNGTELVNDFEGFNKSFKFKKFKLKKTGTRLLKQKLVNRLHNLRLESIVYSLLNRRVVVKIKKLSKLFNIKDYYSVVDKKKMMRYKRLFFFKDYINIFFFSVFFKSSHTLGKFISTNITNKKMHFNFLKKVKRLTETLLSFGNFYNLMGLTIKVFGKFQGVLRKRSFKYYTGVTSNTNIANYIDYSLNQSYTKFGVFSIKVWLYFASGKYVSSKDIDN